MLIEVVQYKIRVGVLFIDLDKFKPVNDTLGHLIGDYLLQNVAKRLRNSLRDTDIVARQGGDEFIVVLKKIDSDQIACHVANKIIQTLSVVKESYQLIARGFQPATGVLVAFIVSKNLKCF